jgi:hypothetical protein
VGDQSTYSAYVHTTFRGEFSLDFRRALRGHTCPRFQVVNAAPKRSDGSVSSDQHRPAKKAHGVPRRRSTEALRRRRVVRCAEKACGFMPVPAWFLNVECDRMHRAWSRLIEDIGLQALQVCVIFCMRVARVHVGSSIL